MSTLVVHDDTRPLVTYGEWERAPDVAPILVQDPFGIRLKYAYRRRVYETWWQDGQKMGRWNWEYSA